MAPPCWASVFTPQLTCVYNTLFSSDQAQYNGNVIQTLLFGRAIMSVIKTQLQPMVETVLQDMENSLDHPDFVPKWVSSPRKTSTFSRMYGVPIACDRCRYGLWAWLKTVAQVVCYKLPLQIRSILVGAGKDTPAMNDWTEFAMAMKPYPCACTIHDSIVMMNGISYFHTSDRSLINYIVSYIIEDAVHKNNNDLKTVYGAYHEFFDAIVQCPEFACAILDEFVEIDMGVSRVSAEKMDWWFALAIASCMKKYVK